MDKGVDEAVDAVVDEAEDPGKELGGVGSGFGEVRSDTWGVAVLAAKSLAIDI